MNDRNTSALHAVVIGGSIGGLACAVALRRIGVEVTVFERSMGRLHDRGAGLGVDLPLLGGFLDAKTRAAVPALQLHRQRVVDDTGSTYTRPMAIHVTSYDAIYRALRSQVPDETYRQGNELVAIALDHKTVRAHFANGTEASGGLMVGADGYASSTRRLLPESTDPPEPVYAGYLLWRGLLDEADVDPGIRDFFFDGSLHLLARAPYHLVAYAVPGADGATSVGTRRLNWGWYFPALWNDAAELLRDRAGRLQHRSLPIGDVAAATSDYLAGHARRTWSGPWRDLIQSTIEAERLFAAGIFEYRPERMTDGRICLLGDAAHTASPITGSGARFALLDAQQLATSLSTHRGAEWHVAAGLKDYETHRLPIAQRLVDLGREFAATLRPVPNHQ